MKSFISALVIFALLLTGFAVYNLVLTRTVETLCAFADSGDIPALSKAFSESKPLFGIFLNHQEVAALEDSVARLLVLYRSEAEIDRLCEQQLFISRLRALHENEGLEIINIF